MTGELDKHGRSSQARLIVFSCCAATVMIGMLVLFLGFDDWDGFFPTELGLESPRSSLCVFFLWHFLDTRTPSEKVGRTSTFVSR